jgi:DNA-directed RNA polymerase
MTLAYGSKQYGFKQNLLTDIIHPYVLDHPDDVVFVNPNQAATYMAKLIWDAVGATVIKAVEGMSWLQDVAALISSGGNVVTWTTPNGLPVQQNYMKEEVVVKHLRFNKARIRIYTTQEKDTEEIDNNAQRNGIAPNFIHSMDACHLQRVVMAEKTAGNNNFMMIHDSFGTDCAHAGDLYKTIRSQFIGLYKDQNHLQTFMEQVAYLIPDDEEVNDIPSFGKLNLDDVAESDFCFA